MEKHLILKLCPLHWTNLKTAIDERGLSRFILNDVTKLKTYITNPNNFEPLYNAYQSIVIMAVSIMETGPNLDQPSEQCPICYGKESGLAWIEKAADLQLHEAFRLGKLAAA